MSYKLIIIIILINLNIYLVRSQISEPFNYINIELPSEVTYQAIQAETMIDEPFGGGSRAQLRAGGGPGSDPGGLLGEEDAPINDSYIIFAFILGYIFYIKYFSKR